MKTTILASGTFCGSDYNADCDVAVLCLDEKMRDRLVAMFEITNKTVGLFKEMDAHATSVNVLAPLPMAWLTGDKFEEIFGADLGDVEGFSIVACENPDPSCS